MQPGRREDWERLAAGPRRTQDPLVATDHAGQVVGYTAAHPDDGELFLLFVHPARARREHNERALAVYARAGYRPDGSDRRSDFNGTPIRELRLVKDL